MNASLRGSPGPEGTRKRRRTMLACNECREKKRKCDGCKPTCNACSHRGILDCVWDEERSNKVWNSRYVDSLKARIRELESQQERPSLQTRLQHDDMPFTPETGPQNYRGVDPGPLQVKPEAIRSSENHAVIPSPCDQPHPHRDQSADSANGLSNPSYLLLDWSLDVSLPLNTNLASLVNLDEGAAAVTDNEDDGVDAMGVIACFPAPNCGRKRRPSNYFGPSSTKGLLDKARTPIDKGRRTNLPDSFVTPSSQITEDRPLHFTGCTSTVLWI